MWKTKQVKKKMSPLLILGKQIVYKKTDVVIFASALNHVSTVITM